MLFRTFLFSLLLHLAFILSLERLLPPSQWYLTPGNRELSASLQKAGQGELATFGAPQGDIVSPSDRVIRQVKQKQKQIPQSSNLPPFSASTAATAKQTPVRATAVEMDQQAELTTVSTEMLSQYRLNIARVARQFKVYPPLARDEGWQGVVVIVVAIGPGMASPIVSLGRSSGYRLLDHQALEMINHAVQKADLPRGLLDKQMSISLPVEYTLAD